MKKCIFTKQGHDTTAAGSSFALCVLGARMDVQDRVMQEINQIFQGSDRHCTFADTVEMKYLERVILESLRLYPPVPVISREVTQDVKLGMCIKIVFNAYLTSVFAASGDYSIPANSTVIIAQYMMHRNEEYYPNPLEFNPDRFLPEECQKRHYYSFIPFSAGPRSCVGTSIGFLKFLWKKKTSSNLNCRTQIRYVEVEGVVIDDFEEIQSHLERSGVRIPSAGRHHSEAIKRIYSATRRAPESGRLVL